MRELKQALMVLWTGLSSRNNRGLHPLYVLIISCKQEYDAGMTSNRSLAENGELELKLILIARQAPE